MISSNEGNGKTILVSGINGYIASWIGLELLKKGYTLRGTARSKESTKPLLEGAYKEYTSRVEIVEVPDFLVSGAFDEAVKGVVGILHTASPINFEIKDPDLFYKPAIQGTVGILQSALDHAGPQLKSVVVTSSVAAITRPVQGYYKFTEADWNDYSEKLVAEKGLQAPPSIMYTASKTLAERAIWTFKDEKKPPFAITAINPSVVYGPPLLLPPTADKLNETVRIIWNIFSGAEIPPPIGSSGYCDVRDVAKVHVWAVEHPSESGGRRFMVINGQGLPQAIADILHKAYPERSSIIPKGTPGQGYMPDYSFLPNGVDFDISKTPKAVGIQFIGLEQSVLDTAKVLEHYL